MTTAEFINQMQALLDAYKSGVRDANNGAEAERNRIVALLVNPSEEFVEAYSRKYHPGAWARVDKNMDNDDWNGGTALNLRTTLLRDARAACSALAEIIKGGGE